MKKIILFLMLTITCCYSSFVFSNNINTNNTPEIKWNGFYVGGNVGYWWSPTSNVSTTGSASYVYPPFASGASNIANALANVGTNNFSLDPNGLIGGGQIGYNYLFNKGLLIGLVMDFDASSNSNNSYVLQKTTNLVDFDENYISSLSTQQKINYLGTVRARLGYLYQPTVLFYVTGGFAYGNVTLDSTWTAQESLGPSVFPAINTQNNSTKTLTGWTAGGGAEWFFKSNWSVNMEYIYYHLNHLNSEFTLSQYNTSLSPTVLWGSASVNTALSLSVSTIRVGINYHFS